jgi:hypothetical protein
LEDCYSVGKLAVYPGLKDDVLNDRLTRANERIKVVHEIEGLAARAGKLVEKYEDRQIASNI